MEKMKLSNDEKQKAFSLKIFKDINSAMSVLNLYVGYKLKLFEALA